MKFQVPVLNIVGAESPFVEEAVTFNKKLNPEKSEYFKVVVIFLHTFFECELMLRYFKSV